MEKYCLFLLGKHLTPCVHPRIVTQTRVKHPTNCDIFANNGILVDIFYCVFPIDYIRPCYLHIFEFQ